MLRERRYILFLFLFHCCRFADVRGLFALFFLYSQNVVLACFIYEMRVPQFALRYVVTFDRLGLGLFVQGRCRTCGFEAGVRSS